jgi:hypothetical protein
VPDRIIETQKGIKLKIEQKCEKTAMSIDDPPVFFSGGRFVWSRENNYRSKTSKMKYDATVLNGLERNPKI